MFNTIFTHYFFSQKNKEKNTNFSKINAPKWGEFVTIN